MLLYHASVLPEWTDYNGHFNVAYYALAFDQAAQAFWMGKGLSQTPETVRCAIHYAAEAHAGTHLSFAARALATFDLEDGRQVVIRIAMFEGTNPSPIAVQERRERVSDPSLIRSLEFSELGDVDLFTPKGWEAIVTI